MTTMRVDSDLTAPRRRPGETTHRHKLPLCQATGLPRYRDRHQARQGAKAAHSPSQQVEVGTFGCPDCRGWHVERVRKPRALTTGPAPQPVAAFTASLSTRRRRYVLFDVENPTRAARATSAEVAALWSILKRQAPGFGPQDHIVVGAARGVARRYRPAISGKNVRWVIGAAAPEAADLALLRAIDLHRVARQYDELVIISGDGRFADLARRASNAGLSVQVITAEYPDQRRPMLSRELSDAATTHTVIHVQPRNQRESAGRLPLAEAA